MTILYLSHYANQLSVVEVDDAGNLIKTIQTMSFVEEAPLNSMSKGNKNDNALVHATVMIHHCPKKRLLYAVATFLDPVPSIIKAFAIQEDGSLVQLGKSISSKGVRASSGSFSEDGSTFVVGHDYIGSMTVFRVLEDQPPVLLQTMKLPRWNALPHDALVVSDSDDCPDDSDFPTRISHVRYCPPTGSLPETLVVCDSAQDTVFVFAVDEQGLILDKTPLLQLPCRPTLSKNDTTKGVGWFQQMFRHQVQTNGRFRYGFQLCLATLAEDPTADQDAPKSALLYCLGELCNSIQVYRIHFGQDSMSWTVNPSPLQEIVVAGYSLRSEWLIGFGITVVGALDVFAEKQMAIVSVQGLVPRRMGKAESGINVLRQMEDGRLDIGQWIPTPGPAIHFARNASHLFVAVAANNDNEACVQKYVMQEDGQWKYTGQACVSKDVSSVILL